jgi:hypothetical protein
MQALDERAAKIAEKSTKNAEPKQESLAKADADTLRKEAQTFKDRADKVVKAYDDGDYDKDLLKRKEIAMEKVSNYYDDLSPALKDHPQIREIYDNARIHFDYDEGEYTLTAKEKQLTEDFSKSVDKLNLDEKQANEIMSAVNRDIEKKNIMPVRA